MSTEEEHIVRVLRESSEPLFPSEHTVAEPLTVPPTDSGFTVMVLTVENSTQLPAVILARY